VQNGTDHQREAKRTGQEKKNFESVVGLSKVGKKTGINKRRSNLRGIGLEKGGELLLLHISMAKKGAGEITPFTKQ